ncbi:MAG: N-acetylneuraminate synthase family protein [Planctomycetota bacterium]|nr:N-acetylneuraminate synthase family protein [Planctomycetota bacterium]
MGTRHEVVRAGASNAGDDRASGLGSIRELRIGGRLIGGRSTGGRGGEGRNTTALAPVYVIAELGVNHDGDVERALSLVDAAKKAGADAIKVQVFRAELLLSGDATLAAYQAGAGEHDPGAMLRRLELPMESLARVARAARSAGLQAIATVFSLPLVREAEAIGFDAYKVASPDIVHRPLLEALVRTGRPLILSTGAATLGEVRRAREWLGETWSRAGVLQCVSSYPTTRENAALEAMADLAALTPAAVGYSDHTTEIDAGADAVRMGATILEKHLTYDSGAPGPDHAASLDPVQFEQYVAWAREAADLPRAVARATGAKRVLECERDVRRSSRQSCVAARDLRAGQTLTIDDVVFKRPGTGLPPYRLVDALGRTLERDVTADRVIHPEDVGLAPEQPLASKPSDARSQESDPSQGGISGARSRAA